MHFNIVLSFIVGLTCTARAAVVPEAFHHTLEERDLTPDNSCATGVHVVVGPGWDRGGTDYGTIGRLTRKILRAIPGSNSFLLGPFPHPGTGFVTSTSAVTKQLKRYLQEYNAACPGTYIVLIGTSAGAVASMNALCGDSPSPPWPAGAGVVDRYPFLAAVFYGDETYNGAMPYDTGTCTVNAPNGYRTDSSTCRKFYSKMQSYCDVQDPFCCTGGTKPGSHMKYGPKYDTLSVEFIVGKWNDAIAPP